MMYWVVNYGEKEDILACVEEIALFLEKIGIPVVDRNKAMWQLDQFDEFDCLEDFGVEITAQYPWN